MCDVVSHHFWKVATNKETIFVRAIEFDSGVGRRLWHSIWAQSQEDLARAERNFILMKMMPIGRRN